MGIFDNFKAFIHSITTDDHYASYDSSTKFANNNQHRFGDNDLTNQSTTNLTNGSSIRLNNNDSAYSLNEQTPGFYRPGLKSSQQDLPLQDFSSEGQPPLPSIDSLWDRIESWIEEEYPELEDNLNDGVTSADLNEFVQDLKAGTNELPLDFKQFYKRHDGQLRGGKPTGLIMGLVLLDLEGIIEEQILWNKVAERLQSQYYIQQKQNDGTSSSSTTNNNSFISNQRSIPPNSIQPHYYNRGWVILLKDNIGNQIAMDLNPGSNGIYGQIILFGRDFDTKLVIAKNLQEFIFGYVSDLEQGNYIIDSSEYRETFGYLSNDRNGDFMVGDEDEDQGELSFWDKDGIEFGKNFKNSRLNYIEILKKRALKKYGLNESFQTIYQPQRVNKKVNNSGINSPILNQSRNSSSYNIKPLNSNTPLNKPNISSPLVNLDNNSSSFTVPKETIIDNKETKDVTESEDATTKEEPKKDEPIHIKPEVTPKEEEEEVPAKEEDIEETQSASEEKEEPKDDLEEIVVEEAEDNETEEIEEQEDDNETNDDNNNELASKPLTKNQKKKQKKKNKKP
ncbi:unnamed protein product [Candida verbasci]|uniref:Knr4/Smi1-like domain-containing protein n=1 Tax=Candida verbasci TaxID=1227364 RepID=A0A9W4TQT9_9ASCO|nr:unnamed protein product [Candida verbasci]